MKEHTNEQPPTGKIIPPRLFTAHRLLCERLRFSVNIPGMCVCGRVRSQEGGAMWMCAGSVVREEVLCVCVCPCVWLCVCVCALSRWMYSRSGCLSELRPDRCDSNLRQYDVIDYLIF